MLPIFRKTRKRRLLSFAALFALLLLVERLPPALMGAMLGYPFETHPLFMPYQQFVFLLNGAFVLLVVLSELRGLRSWLPGLYTLMLGLLLFCTWSAIWLFFVERKSDFAFQLSMWHMGCGRLATPLLILYVFDHVVTWWSTSVPTERRWGRRLVVVFTLIMGIGALFTVLGGPDERYVLVVHSYGAWAVPPLIGWHWWAERRWRSRSAPPSAAAPGVAHIRPWTASRAWTALALSVVLPLGPYALAERWRTEPLPFMTRFIEPMPTDLFRFEEPPPTYVRGEDGGLFRPAHTETESRLLVPERFLQQSRSCGYEGCHTDIAKMWALSGHRHSMNVFVSRVVDQLVAERGIEAARHCAGCHDPVNLLAGRYDRGADRIRGFENEGVTCMVCHATSHVGENPRNGGLRLAATPLFFRRGVERSRYIMTVLFLDDHSAELQHRALFERPEFCGACHTHVLPRELNGSELVVTDKVAEWRESRYGEHGDPATSRNCLDCHMPSVIESYQTQLVRAHRFTSSNTAVAAYYARDPRYDEFASRYFLGIQQAKFTHEEHLGVAQRELAGGFVRLSAAAKAVPDSLRIDVSVTNLEDGHTFPSGITDLVDVWLQVEVRDANGVVAGSSGVPDAAGFLPEDRYRYGVDWFDDEGRRLLHHEAWRVAEVRNERRIRSGETDRASFTFPVAADAVGPLEARVRLRHRRFSQEFVSWALEGESFQAPITDLQEARLELAWPPAR